MLSDGLTDGWTALPVVIRLNAPSGAQCFPTRTQHLGYVADFEASQCTFWCSVLSDEDAAQLPLLRTATVSMHLLVLSAFRPQKVTMELRTRLVSMHLLVLSAFRHSDRKYPIVNHLPVSMHLLVLSAFRLERSVRLAEN